MTTMGKILVFINLLFSLLTGALIIMVFITRTNWAAGYAQVSRDLERERAKAENLFQAKNDMEAYDKKQLAIVEGQIDAFKKELQQRILEREDALAKMNEANLRLEAAEATT